MLEAGCVRSSPTIVGGKAAVQTTSINDLRSEQDSVQEGVSRCKILVNHHERRQAIGSQAGLGLA